MVTSISNSYYSIPIGTYRTIEEEIRKNKQDESMPRGQKEFKLKWNRDEAVVLKNVSIEEKKNKFIITAYVKAVEEKKRAVIDITSYTIVKTMSGRTHNKTDEHLLLNFDTRHTLKHL